VHASCEGVPRKCWNVRFRQLLRRTDEQPLLALYVPPSARGAYVVIVMWGIKAASYLLVLIAMALLLAYAFVPLPQWLMSHFRLRKVAAMALTVALLGILNMVTVSVLHDSVVRLRERDCPCTMRISWGYLKSRNFVATEHGINFASLSAIKGSASLHPIISLNYLEFTHVALPEAGGILGEAC